MSDARVDCSGFAALRLLQRALKQRDSLFGRRPKRKDLSLRLAFGIEKRKPEGKAFAGRGSPRGGDSLFGRRPKRKDLSLRLAFGIEKRKPEGKAFLEGERDRGRKASSAPMKGFALRPKAEAQRPRSALQRRTVPRRGASRDTPALKNENRKAKPSGISF
jgi:hypothetical protein